MDVMLLLSSLSPGIEPFTSMNDQRKIAKHDFKYCVMKIETKLSSTSTNILGAILATTIITIHGVG